ncbi:MAG: TlpA disulfide reductase family protein [Pseudomonadota bacterium]
MTDQSEGPSRDDLDRVRKVQQEIDRNTVLLRMDRRRIGGLVIAVAAIALLAYAMLTDRGNDTEVAGADGVFHCEGTHERLDAARPLATGDVAAVLVPEGARRMPDLAFLTPDGEATSLSDWQGKTILVNFWATWCAPCRHEMPLLDELQVELGGDDFEVVAINLDTQDPERAPGFLDEIGVANLPNYNDPENAVVRTLRQDNRRFGFPTSILIDAEGCEIGTLLGPADWASGDAKALIRAVLGAGNAV